MMLTDRVTAGQTRKTADGYLVADARVARTGIQEYTGVEVGKPHLSVVRVYRPEEEVFSADAMRTFAYRPMTSGHPREPVRAENWRDVSVGQTGGEVVRDGDFVRVPMVLMDAGAIAEYEAGKRELSMGYEAEIVFRDGVTPDGQQYDAVQTKLRMNHLALVDRARGGEELRIGDDNSARNTVMPNEIKTRTVLVDGLSVETTDAGAQAIEVLQKRLNDAKAEAEAAQKSHAKMLADKDAELAKRDAEIEKLKKSQLSDADMDAKVKARADLIAKATSIADADYSGKSEAEIRRAAVVARLGDEAVKDKSESYIEARFDILADEAGTDPVRRSIKSNDRKAPPADHGYSASVTALTQGRNYKEA